jgi:hypothetical protein
MPFVDDDNPYAAPKTENPPREPHRDKTCQAWRDNKLLVMRNGAELPDHCLKCGASAEGHRFSRTLYWRRPIYYLILVLINPIIYIVVYFFVRWEAYVTVGLCPRHRKNRARAIALGWLAALAGLVFIIAQAELTDPQYIPGPLRLALIIAGVVLVLGGIIGGVAGSQVLVARRIDYYFVWLANVSPAYLAKLPDWNAPRDLGS